MNEFEPVRFRYTIPEQEWKEIKRRCDKITDKTLMVEYEGVSHPMFFENGELTDIGAWYLYQDMKKREGEYVKEDFSDGMSELGDVHTGPDIFPRDPEE